MTGPRPRAVGRPGRGLAVMLIGGAAGPGAVFLATRQELARVIARAPSPLPDTVRSVSVQGVRPALAARAVAALASLAAVLATRGFLRRLTGLISVALAAGGAAVAVGRGAAAPGPAGAGRGGGPPPGGAGGGGGG